MTAQPKVISVNVGQPTALQVGNHTVVTGINKHSVPGRVRVSSQGLEGDHVMNRKYHGGPDQAVYVYTREDYDHWTEIFGAPEEPGTLGENLLLGGLESARMRVGDRLEISGPGGTESVLLEVSGPRIPCGTLGAQMEDAGFVKRFVKARRPGFYARVLREGSIGRGDLVHFQPVEADAPSIGALFDLHYDKTPDQDQVRAALKAPLAERFRKELEGMVQQQS